MGHAAGGSSGINSRHGVWYEPPSGSMVELAGLSVPPDAPGRVGRHRSSGQGAGKGRGVGGTSVGASAMVMMGVSTAAAQRRGELLMLTQPGAPFPTAKRASRRRRRRARPSGTVAADLWRGSGKPAPPASAVVMSVVIVGARALACCACWLGVVPLCVTRRHATHGAGHSPSRSARPPSAPRRQQQQPQSAAGQGRRRPRSAAVSAGGRGARRSGSRSSALTAMSAELRQLSEAWVAGPTASREAIEVTS
eukprot:COSAG01_NODE_4985_length_4570_cov_2.076046_2_plen_251_part_00